MGFNDAPGSNRIIDREKARAMAETANSNREEAARYRDEGDENLARRIEANSAKDEDRAGEIFDEKKRLEELTDDGLNHETKHLENQIQAAQDLIFQLRRNIKRVEDEKNKRREAKAGELSENLKSRMQ